MLGPLVESACARRRSRRRLPRGRAVASRLRRSPVPRTSADGTRAAWRRRSRRSWPTSATTGTARRAATGARSCRRTSPTSIPSTCAACTSTSSPCRSRPTPTRRTSPRASSARSRRGRSRSAPPAPATRRSRARSRSRSATALEDSPSGLCAWIVEKFGAWSDCDGDVERVVHQGPAAHQHHRRTGSPRRRRRRRGSTTRCARSGASALPQAYVGVPTGIANYPGEVTRTPRSWAEHRYNITHWTEQPPRRPLRRDAGARPLRRRRPGVLPHRPLSTRPPALRVHRAVQRNNLAAKPTPRG